MYLFKWNTQGKEKCPVFQILEYVFPRLIRKYVPPYQVMGCTEKDCEGLVEHYGKVIRFPHVVVLVAGDEKVKVWNIVNGSLILGL